MTKGTFIFEGRLIHFKTVELPDITGRDFVTVTRFWEKNKIVHEKRSCFGKKEKLIIPNILFQINEDIADPLILRSTWKRLIKEEFNKIERVKEITNKEFI